MKERRRRIWKAAGIALLGLMGGSSGCQWSGDHPSIGAADDPPASIAPCGGYRRAYATATVQENPIAPTAEAPATSTAELQLVSAKAAAAQGGADTENKDLARNERAKAAEKDKGYQVDRTLPSPVEGIATPVIPEPQKALPITLGASLALAGVENPVIGLANQAIRTAQGELMQARLLLVPNINVGGDFHNHDGPVQASFGAIRKVTRNVVNYGLGVNTVAAETIKIPGLFINQPLTDVIFAPLVARQVVSNRRFAATATRNQVLLEAADAYLALLGAEGRLAVIRQSEKDFDEIVRLTANYLKTGLGNKPDADRAQADALALRYQELQAQEEVAVASAELAQLLNLDPSTRLNTADVPIQMVVFVDPTIPLPKLLDIALGNRPELMAAAAAIRASQTRVRQEKTRPLLPTIWAGFSADDFGGGAVASTNGNVFNPNGSPNPGGAPSAATGGRTVPSFGHITGRTDIDVFAFWTLRNAGLGNFADIRQRRAELGVAEAERVRILNMVAEQVSEAYNTSAAQFQAIAIERRRVQEATEGFQLDLNLIRAGGPGLGGAGLGGAEAGTGRPRGTRPIEVLDLAKRLALARQALLEALIGFDRAQFQLFVALGQPPTLVVDDDKPTPPSSAALPPTPPAKGSPHDGRSPCGTGLGR
jgi:hypothetical protein